MVRLDRKLWVSIDGTYVVEDGDADARTLLGVAGDEISHARAVALGVIESGAAPDVKQLAVSRNKQRTIQYNKERDHGEE